MKNAFRPSGKFNYLRTLDLPVVIATAIYCCFTQAEFEPVLKEVLSYKAMLNIFIKQMKISIGLAKHFRRKMRLHKLLKERQSR